MNYTEGEHGGIKIAGLNIAGLMLSQTLEAPRLIMSSTNSSDRLTLLSYATFNHHIPIHDQFW